MATIEVDGKTYQVPDDKNLLDACLGLGLDLPYFCWHPSLGSVGSCRQCAVRLYADENDQQGRIVMSCMTPVQEGQRLSIAEEGAQELRDKSIEVTMMNHPHDCPVCEEGGECHLQDMTIMSKHTERQYRGLKKTYNNQYLGPCISHEMNRCIACYRCVRFYNDYAGGDDLAVLASRENVFFGRHEEGCLASVFSGNLVEVCPTGVFTDKTLARSYNRKWDLQSAPSICAGCSLGCNISPGERQGKIKRIVNRYHNDINGYFICDRGRFGYDYINRKERIQHCSIRRTRDSAEEAPDYYETINTIGDYLEGATLGNVIAFGSDRASVEENFALQSLVGSDNFCSGLAEKQQELLQQILSIYEQPQISIPTLRDMEACDAVLILGEDLMNTAPRMALSVRQASRNLSFELAAKSQIPLWQDASVRTLAQEQRSPIIIASVTGTELDSIASHTFTGTAEQLGNLGFAIAHFINEATPRINLEDRELLQQANDIAAVLADATNPLIISGTSANSLAVVQAAAQIAYALSARTAQARTQLSYVLPAANSLGLSLLQRMEDSSEDADSTKYPLSINHMVKRVLDNPGRYTAIIMQNDLYRREDPAVINGFFQALRQCIVIEQQPNATSDKAQITIPAQTIFETEGTLVNNEGRAQRFFEVFDTDNEHSKDNWKTLANIAKNLANRNRIDDLSPELMALAQCETFDDLLNLVQQRGGVFAAWDQVAPNAQFRVAGMKIPRMPHRFSGRTSLKADRKVAEAKQPEDIDSALGFTMEGAPINRPAALNPIVWSPGWNSNEAINKFQDEIDGSLRGGDPGLRLLGSSTTLASNQSANWFQPNEKAMAIGANRLMAIGQARLLDGEFLSALSTALQERAQPVAFQMHSQTAIDFGIREGDATEIQLGDHQLKLPVKYNNAMPLGLIGVPENISTQQQFACTLLPAPVAIRE